MALSDGTLNVCVCLEEAFRITYRGRDSNAMSKKQRLQFDVTHDTLREIDTLKEKLGATTRAELFREALKILAWYHGKRSKGFVIQAKKGNLITELEVL